jgi:hypothetical protein
VIEGFKKYWGLREELKKNLRENDTRNMIIMGVV